MLCAGLICLGVFFPAGPLHAESLANLLEKAIESHDRVLAAKSDVIASQRRAWETLGTWFPTLTPTANYGWEKQNKPLALDSSMPFKEFDLKLTQLLWDFGKTNALVDKARLTVLKSTVSLETARRDMIMEAISAYVNLLRSVDVLNFSIQSEENISRQTGLEKALVESGSGLSTDVLQAKTQLAGAEARRIQNEGRKISAMNRFQSVFNVAPENIPDMERVAVPAASLPDGLDEALETAISNNTRLKTSRFDEEIAAYSISEVRGTKFFPKVEGTVERKWKENVAGTVQYKGETLAKVEMSIPFNLGLTGLDAVEAAKNDLLKAKQTTDAMRRTIEEEVRNAWSSLHIAERTSKSLLTQAGISAAFLDLARKERELGQRSLIDVLSGETSLINAQSDAVSAEADVIIAAFTLLNVTGKLDYAFLHIGEPPADAPESRQE